MPRPVYLVGAILLALSLVPFAFIARTREVSAARTRIAIIRDMGKQPKYTPQTPNPAFADGRAMRMPVEGTLARGDYIEDSKLAHGLDGDKWVETLPVPVTSELMRRGQERFNIYCAACHGLDGYGRGSVPQRAQELADQLQQSTIIPTNYHDPNGAVVKRKPGELFHFITHGVRNMPPYGSQIEIRDRWAIVAYVKALIRSQASELKDVPEDRRNDLR